MQIVAFDDRSVAKEVRIVTLLQDGGAQSRRTQRLRSKITEFPRFHQDFLVNSVEKIHMIHQDLSNKLSLGLTMPLGEFTKV